jgi:hypothetical protein
MLFLPAARVALVTAFAPLCSQSMRCMGHHTQVLLVGIILVPGRRMFSSVLRAPGVRRLPAFQTHHPHLGSGGPVKPGCQVHPARPSSSGVRLVHDKGIGR